MSNSVSRVVASALVCVLASTAAPAAEPVDYAKEIKPLLKARCWACHGALQQKSKLRLDTAELIRKGGRTGPAVVAGRSVDSPLIHAVMGDGRTRMPPDGEGETLSAKQIDLFKRWIDTGARGLDNEQPEEDPRRHWAFQQPVRPLVPRVARYDWTRNPLDAFLAAEHEKRQVQPASPVAKPTLLRRVYLDLIGLPPTRAEMHAFLADTSDTAYEKVVERLLNDPRHGERWARHWMDVWRYSDWYGRRAVPDVWNSAPQIWRWRDWIVKSLNTDMGYDRMVQAMLAADELTPEDDANLVATGYLVRGWYALNSNQWMRELVEHTGKAFLGLTFQCAHCHDHKYDPIRQEEYFRFRAFFEPLEPRQDRVPGEPDPGPFQKYEYSKLRKVVQTGMIRVLDEKPDAKTFMYRGGDERDRIEGKPPVRPAAPAFLGGDALTIQPVTLPAAAHYPGLKAFVREAELAAREKAVAAALELSTGNLSEARLAAAEAELTALRARIAADEARFRMGGGTIEELSRAAARAERRAILVAAREKLLQAEQALLIARLKPEAAALRAKLEPQVAAARKAVETADKALAAAGSQYTPLSPTYPTTSTGRRRALAEWLTGRDNPLTARVAVNHIWMRHFDRPLVESVSDFGRSGKRPTHPELLDWLAVELMDSGWSMKHLHRLIVTSSAYRMGTGGATLQAADPDNRWLWCFPARRVEAEVVRDSLLHVAGELDFRPGGPPLDNKEEAAARRRSLYFSVYPEDGGHPKFLELFDAPDPCDCYRRSSSILPQQALVMTNSSLAVDMSRVLARKLWEQTGDESAFVRIAFEQVLSREPTTEEQAACLDLLRKQRQLHRDTKSATGLDSQLRACASVVRALFSHDEFVTIR